MSFICHIHNYTEYNEEWNVFSAFNPSKCTHLEQWAADCAAPGDCRLRYGQLKALPLAAQHRRERGDTAPGVRPSVRGAVLETSSNWTIAKVFSKKSVGLSLMSLLWKKSHQNVLKVAKYCAKFALVCETWELMAADGGYLHLHLCI